MNEKALVTKISTFTSKKTTPETNYYVVEALLKKESVSDGALGHEYIKVFTTKEKYDTIKSKFKLLLEIDVLIRYENGRVKFEVA